MIKNKDIADIEIKLSKLPRDEVHKLLLLHLSGFSDFFLNIASYGDEVEKTLGARVDAKTLAPLSFTILNTIIYSYHEENGPYHKDIKKLNSATGIVNVKRDSFFVNGHFPGQPVMPGVLIVEAFGQTAAALTAHGIDKSTYENKLVFLMGVEKARFRNPVIPDCKLLLKIEAIRSHGRVWKYKGEAFVDDKKMADAIWSATIVDKK